MGRLYNSKGKQVKWSVLPEVLTCDIETTGLDYAFDEITLVQVGTAGEQWYTDEIDLEMFKELEKHKLIFHHGKFDTKFLANKFGKLLDIYGDTMVMLHASGWEHGYDLKGSCERILHVKGWDIPLYLKTEQDINKIFKHIVVKDLSGNWEFEKEIKAYMPKNIKDMIKGYPDNEEKLKEVLQEFCTELFITYSLCDVKYGYMLADRLLEQMDDKDFNVYDHELRAYSAFRMIELTGSYIGNVEKSDAIIEKMLIEKELEIGLRLDWIGSTKKLGALLYDGMKLPILWRTPKGAPSTARGVLQDLSKRDKFCGDLVEYSTIKKLRQFFKSWMNLQVDGKIRPQFNIMARTGRTTSKEPNLQQVPQNSYVRNMITAPPGWKFIEADYSQLELRCAAFCAQDPVMLEAYKHDADLHNKTWNNLSGGAPYSEDHDIAKRQRTIAKTCNFGLLYGAGANALITYAKGMGVEMTVEEATQYRDAFFSGYPRLLPWHNECVQNATNFGYSQTPSGRKRHLRNIYSTNFADRAQAQRQSINSPVQGLGSDICVSAMTKITEHPEYGSTFYIYGTVHDAILVIAEERHVERVAYEIIKPIMERPPVIDDIPNNETLYLKADVEIGQSWGGGQQEFL